MKETNRGIASRVILFLVCAVLLAMGGCGGGGGGGNSSSGSTLPYIQASVTSFPTGAVLPGFATSTTNSYVTVNVLDKAGGTPATNATVTINGVALAYDSHYADYEGPISISPGQPVQLTVTLNGTTYSAAAAQVSSYPTIQAPLANANWSTGSSNLISWSSTSLTANAAYAIGIFGWNGSLMWPTNGRAIILPTSTTSYAIAPNSMAGGSVWVFVAQTYSTIVPNADPSSYIQLIGANYQPLTITTSQAPSTTPVTLSAISITPASAVITPGQTQQFTATGLYSDNSTRDLTAQVNWSSSNQSHATTGTAGLATGIGAGPAGITATLGSLTASANLNVFQPVPSVTSGQSVAYQIDYAHTGQANLNSAVSFPNAATWSVQFNGSLSYPLIAGGKVFVMSSLSPTGTNVSQLYALDERTGAVIWGPIPIQSTINWAGFAYDNGKLFVVNFDGFMQSFDAATGQTGWVTRLPGQYAFTSPPTAVNGIVYTGGAGSAGTLYAVDESNGNVLWTAGVWNGDHSSPAVSSDGVFVTYPCQAYKFSPYTGALLWRYNGPCEGGGGRTPVYANGLLYMRDPGNGGMVFNAGTGALVGTSASGVIPAVGPQYQYLQSGGVLQAISLSTNSTAWTFSNGDPLVSAPITVNQYVVVGSGTGHVYAIDSATGAQVWSGNAGAAMTAPDEHNATLLTGMGAGEGYLVVPAGNVLTAWKVVP